MLHGHVISVWKVLMLKRCKLLKGVIGMAYKRCVEGDEEVE